MNDSLTLTKTAPPRMLRPDQRTHARLVAYLVNGTTRSVPIVSVLEVGRRRTNGLVTGDPRSSGSHFRCRERRDTREVTLEDLGSSNGTRVNGRFVSEVILHDGDVVRCGDTVLVYEAATISGVEESAEVSRASARLQMELVGAIDDPQSLLLTGETGTGKGFTASLFAAQVRPHGRLVTVNCAAIPEQLFESELFGHKRGAFSGAAADKPGLVETAHGGVVFLDELAEVSIGMQAKLLRAIETGLIRRVGETRERSVDVMWIAATNVDPHGGGLRRDLFYRFANPHIVLPPLRSRRVDLIPLLRQLAKVSGHEAFTPEGLEALLTYDWPGNVRELVTIARRLSRHQGGIDYTDLPAQLSKPYAEHLSGKRQTKRPPSREEMQAVFDDARGNVAEVARRLGHHRTQITRWLKAYGIKK